MTAQYVRRFQKAAQRLGMGLDAAQAFAVSLQTSGEPACLRALFSTLTESQQDRLLRGLDWLPLPGAPVEAIKADPARVAASFTYCDGCTTRPACKMRGACIDAIPEAEPPTFAAVGPACACTRAGVRAWECNAGCLGKP